jgi:hypothetical protein
MVKSLNFQPPVLLVGAGGTTARVVAFGVSVQGIPLPRLIVQLIIVPLSAGRLNIVPQSLLSV